jgi:TatD DNase family protein
MFIDTHAHLNFREYEKDIKDVLERSFDAEVKKIINVGSNYKTSVKSVKSIKGVELYSVIGCHPIHLTSDITETAKFDGKEYKFTTKKEEFDVKKYQKIIDSSDKVVAVGETGLDYYHLKTQNSKLKTISKNLKLEKEIQKKVFKKHIELAIENNLPLVLHCRGSGNDQYGAYDEMLKIIKFYNLNLKSNLRGVAHCFVGNLAQAKEFIKMGFYIGVNGIVTFKNSKELQNIIKEIPLKNIVLETDCPFLAPDPYRGKRNEPAYIPIIAQKIAELKNININEVKQQTTANSQKLFNIV